MSTYVNFKSALEPEKYLLMNLKFKVYQIFACFRCSCLPLNVEVGRRAGIDRKERFCKVCRSNKVEDEFHFLLECPVYNDLRRKYIPHFFRLSKTFVNFTVYYAQEMNLFYTSYVYLFTRHFRSVKKL